MCITNIQLHLFVNHSATIGTEGDNEPNYTHTDAPVTHIALQLFLCHIRSGLTLNIYFCRIGIEIDDMVMVRLKIVQHRHVLDLQWKPLQIKCLHGCSADKVFMNGVI